MPPTFDATTRLHRASKAVWRAFDHETAVIDPALTGVFTLNQVGARCWELAEGRTAQELTDLLLNEFEVDRNQLEEDVYRFLGDLVQRGLLVTESFEQQSPVR